MKIIKASLFLVICLPLMALGYLGGYLSYHVAHASWYGWKAAREEMLGNDKT